MNAGEKRALELCLRALHEGKRGCDPIPLVECSRVERDQIRALVNEVRAEQGDEPLAAGEEPLGDDLVSVGQNVLVMLPVEGLR